MSDFRFKTIVFDFDGVLAESVDVKTKAFADLYRQYGEDIVEQVVAYHLAHGGLSRYEKFKYYHNTLLGKALTQSEEEELGHRFSQLVEQAVIAAPMVPGAQEFLDQFHGKIPLYVASGTPHVELQRIIDQRGMRKYFQEAFGSPEKKDSILKKITDAMNVAPTEVLMVGDAMTDYEGAKSASTAFIGRVLASGINPFPVGTPTLQNLTKLADFVRCP